MKTKHTPGPWEMEDRQSEGGNNCGINVMALQNQLIVCRIPDGASTYGGFGFPHQLANAKLIAAAPDLLGVLKDIVYTWENFNVNRESQMGEAIQYAKEAIKKAGAE